MMQCYKCTQSSLDVNKLLTFPSSVGALWPSVPGPAWYHWLQNHHSDNCKKNIYQNVQRISMKYSKTVMQAYVSEALKWFSGKLQEEQGSITPTHRAWFPLKNYPIARESTGSILLHVLPSRSVLYWKSETWCTACLNAEFQFNKNSNIQYNEEQH